MNMQLKIIECLKYQLSVSDRPSYGIERSHIFYALLNSIIDKVSLEDKMDMLYHFDAIRKILALCRSKKTNLALGALHELQSTGIVYQNKIAEIGMEAIHLPMVAYFDFINRDFSNAREKLEDSIVLLEYLIKQGIYEAKIAIIEQYFNLFKVHVLKGNTEAASSLAFDIIHFCGTNKPNNSFKNILNSSAEQYAILHHYINGIMKMLFHYGQYVEINQLNIEVLRLLRDLLMRSEDPYALPNFKEALLLSLTESPYQVNAFFRTVPIGNTFMPEMPSLIQYNILAMILESEQPSLEIPEELGKTISSYSNAILGIPLKQRIPLA